MRNSRRPIYTWLSAAFIVAAGIIITGSVFASEIVPTDKGVLRQITNPLTSTTVDTSTALPTGIPGSAQQIVPHFSGVNTKFLVNEGQSPFEIVDDSVVSGILDLRNGIINNGTKVLPDLIVSSLSTSPSTYVTAGNQITVYWKVTNQGGDSAPASTSRLCAWSIDGLSCIKGTNVINIAEKQVGALAPNAQTSLFSATWTVRANSAGPQTIFACADVGSSTTSTAMMESDESNNCATKSLTVSLPPLYVSNDSASPVAATVYSGAEDVPVLKLDLINGSSKAMTVSQLKINKINYSWNNDLQNLKLYDDSGTSLLAGPVNFAADGSATFGNLSIGIAGNGTTKVMIKTGISGTTSPHDFYVGLLNSSSIVATDTDGNPAAAQARYPNSYYFPSISSKFTIADPTLKLEHTTVMPPATNVGRGTSNNPTTKLKLSTIGREIQIGTIAVQKDQGTIVDNDISGLKLFREDTGQQVGGTATLIGGIATFDVSNSPLVVNPNQPVNLFLKTDISASAVLGRTFSFKANDIAEISNSGRVTKVTYTSPASNLMTIAPRLNLSLAANTTPAGYLATPSSSNNITQITFAAPDQDISISQIKIKQNGTAPYSAISSIKIFDGINQIGFATPSNVKTTINLSPIPQISSGTKTLTIKADIASGAVNNDTVILGIESATDITAGTVAVNGAFPVYGSTFTIAKPDVLVVSPLSVSSTTPNAGDTITIGSVIKNQGNVSTGISFTAILQAYQGAGTNLQTYVVQPLAANTSEATHTWTWTIPVNYTGNYNVQVCADQYTQLAESDEGNNCTSQSITVSPPPDLVPQIVGTPPTTVVKGTNYGITFNVKNQGSSVHASTSGVYRVCVDNPDCLNVASARFGEASIPTLSSNTTSTDIPSTWSNTSIWSAGGHTIYVCVDAYESPTVGTGAVPESDDSISSNCVTRTVTLTDPPTLTFTRLDSGTGDPIKNTAPPGLITHFSVKASNGNSTMTRIKLETRGTASGRFLLKLFNTANMSKELATVDNFTVDGNRIVADFILPSAQYQTITNNYTNYYKVIGYGCSLQSSKTFDLVLANGADVTTAETNVTKNGAPFPERLRSNVVACPFNFGGFSVGGGYTFY